MQWNKWTGEDVQDKNPQELAKKKGFTEAFSKLTKICSQGYLAETVAVENRSIGDDFFCPQNFRYWLVILCDFMRSTRD